MLGIVRQTKSGIHNIFLILLLPIMNGMIMSVITHIIETKIHTNIIKLKTLSSKLLGEFFVYKNW